MCLNVNKQIFINIIMLSIDNEVKSTENNERKDFLKFKDMGFYRISKFR